MSLDDIRDASRASIHSAFAIPAVARSRDGLSQVPLTARLHRELRKPFGDLDREGFSLAIESYNQVILDTQEPGVSVIGKNWILDFGRGRVVNMDNNITANGERYAKWLVSEHNSDR